MSQIRNDPPLIELRSVIKVYGKGEAASYALRGVDMIIEKGEFVSIMGASGSGKSTAMNILGCLDTPSSGEYLFKGINVGTLGRNHRALLRRNYIGFVFQGYNLLGRTTAVENVELPLIYRRIPKAQRKALSLKALESVGLKELADHTPAELSGGQQQRAAIARAIVTEPLILLADEPTGNLDSANSIEVMNLLKRFNEELGVTIVMVTHEEEMAKFAHRIVRFKDGLIDVDNLSKKAV